MRTLSGAESLIAASTFGNGNSGKIKIAAGGSVLVSDSNAIVSTVQSTGTGDSGGIQIDASSFELRNGGQILTFAEASPTGQKGNAGSVDIKTTKDITISGTKDRSILDEGDALAKIESSTYREGNAGKITLVAPGKLSVVNRGAILSSIRDNGVGNSGGITLNVGELVVANSSVIISSLGAFDEFNTKGNAGNIDITATGNITINEDRIVQSLEGDEFSASLISTSVTGTGNGGNITISTPGKVSLGNRNQINSTIEDKAQGNGGNIKINAGELAVFNQGQILTTVFDLTTQDGKTGNTGYNAGNIDITTTGNITVAGHTNLALVKDDTNSYQAKIASSSLRNNSNAGKITLDAGGNISLLNTGGIITTYKPETIDSKNRSGGITIRSKQLNLDRGDISVESTDKGGNINIATQEWVLMQRYSSISTSSTKGGDGGNIALDSKFLIAVPKENSDIVSSAIKGQGGNVNINAQGVFGIQFRPLRTENSDIIVSSEFGRSGNVQINTPGTDPSKNKGELVAAPNDASKQISQACSASQRDHKFYMTGRGGLPPNAREPQESEALWEDARAVKATPATTADLPRKYPPPAIGWVFEKKGRVRLIAAQSAERAIGSKVVCPAQ
ncbi:S-layer family protein [Chamaesiphon sp. VAR_48_metabat_135_sub]|uniref:S-layer family protein n=1 Tax=Chamaesiphon sp. VAR_48_metabat_135_sub TaxID=2964699 RepID=UPI00286B5EFD|nr:S-layer family protein [Chamaesiphon sp. VAR_48_metabat_135_sub]